MQRARTVGTGFPVPPVTIACNPVVKDARRPMDPRNKQNPRQEVPARKPQTDLSPGVHPRVNVAQIIDGLHRTHGLFPINIGKSANRAGIVKVEKLDTPIAVERANTFNAGTAERTRSIKEHGELRKIWHDSRTARFSVARLASRHAFASSWPVGTLPRCVRHSATLRGYQGPNKTQGHGYL